MRVKVILKGSDLLPERDSENDIDVRSCLTDPKNIDSRPNGFKFKYSYSNTQTSKNSFTAPVSTVQFYTCLNLSLCRRDAGGQVTSSAVVSHGAGLLISAS